jgi:hypothetical protein
MNRASPNRGQVVLMAAGVAAVALLAMVVAFAQLGLSATASPPDPVLDLDAVSDSLRVTTTAHVFDNAGQFRWSERSTAVSALQDQLRPDIKRLERTTMANGRGISIKMNATVPQQLHLTCPEGTDKQFGNCLIVDGVVIQERAGETTVIAVSYDIEVISPVERSYARVVIRIPG